MGAPKRITRETILQSAFTLLCKEGYEALNARSLARKMGCSTQPIYAAFGRMDALKKSLKELAEEKYIKSTRRELESGKYNAYKSYGVGFVRFAREEKQLFRYLYMRGRRGEKLIEDVNQKYGNTVIMVTHNDAIKNMADRVIRLRDGQIRKNYVNETKIAAGDLDW